MTSWPNIPKGLRKGMRTPNRRTAPQGDWIGGKGGGRGPYYCWHPGCGLVYTPGKYRQHAKAYHGNRDD